MGHRSCVVALGALVVATVALLPPPAARAVPSFARKYRTSCQTCHTVFPKLNPFGEAFRYGGYQYPTGDLDMQKGEPLDLGSEKYKDVFPDAVWPGSIMESVPLSLRLTGAVRFDLSEDADVLSDFQFPALAALNFAGTLSEDIALWFGTHATADGEVAVNKALFVFSNLFSNVGVPRHLLNIRVGQFEPEAQPFSMHRLTTISSSTFAAFQTSRWFSGAATGLGTTHVHLEAAEDPHAGHGDHTTTDPPETPAEDPAAADGGTADGHTDGDTETAAASLTGGSPFFGMDRGIEFYGIVASRLLYAVGVFNGNGAGTLSDGAFDSASGKDVTARLAWKFGGMGLDGSGEQDPKPWREYSVLVGGFARYGSTDYELTRATGDTGSYNGTLLRTGGDLDVRLSDVELVGAVAWQRQTNFAGDGEALEALGWFGEVHVFWLPWLESAVRYEGVAVGHHFDDIVEQDAVASIAFLIRPNLKGVVEGVVDLRDVDAFAHGRHAAYLGLDAAF